MSSCGQREVLVDNSWILIGGTFKGKLIEFKSTDRAFFTDKNGRVIRSLHFSEDETILLPGINSSDISARWTSKGNEICFSIDSMKYSMGSFDPGIFLPGDSKAYNSSTDELKEFEEAMRIYAQVFEYRISRDTLSLFSKDVKLWAVRDRRIDDMFKDL